MLINLGCQVSGHVGGGEIANGAKGEAGDEAIIAVEVVLYRVGRKHKNVCLLGEKEHHAKVTDALLGEMR